jgi:ubiquinone/menaquinone biosynthesis C-methylase UbiE
MDTQPAAGEQAILWNGRAGQAWVDAQELLDLILKPFEDVLLEAIAASNVNRVLDIGCGTGSTTLAAARMLGAKGSCVGIDISEPMIALARSRASEEQVPASFICADAQTHVFEPASFDAMISRFGVMFFDDPVSAFANLHRAARPGAELVALAWRSCAENPFMTTAERAAAPFLPSIPARKPNGPGQFAFADEHKVRVILEESGWRDIDIQPIDVASSLPEKELNHYLTRLGPLGLILQDADEATRAHITGVVRAAFDPFVQGEDVRFTAACWMVRARAPRLAQ